MAAGGCDGTGGRWRGSWPSWSRRCVLVIVLTSGSSTSGAGQLFQAVLRPVPDNQVTGSGTAAVTLHGDVATFTVDATGLLDGGSHPIHLHAFG